MKWGLVVACLSDMNRPVENVSIPQCSGTSSLHYMIVSSKRILIFV